jgi:hypothetical protein
MADSAIRDQVGDLRNLSMIRAQPMGPIIRELRFSITMPALPEKDALEVI